MLNKKLTKLVGIKKDLFDSFVESGQIQVQRAKLIPTLKTGDEMAHTSIFLSSFLPFFLSSFLPFFLKVGKRIQTGYFP